jgi:hypothetical protein
MICFFHLFLFLPLHLLLLLHLHSFPSSSSRSFSDFEGNSLPPSLLLSAIWFGTYLSLKDGFDRHYDNDSWQVSAFCSILAGITSVTFTCPIWVVKTRMQLQTNLAANAAKRNYKNSLDCVYRMWREEGISTHPFLFFSSSFLLLFSSLFLFLFLFLFMFLCRCFTLSLLLPPLSTIDTTFFLPQVSLPFTRGSLLLILGLQSRWFNWWHTTE